MSKSKYILIYSTFPSRKEAEKISSELVRKKLIACANIGQEITSIYEWKSKIENSKEIPVFFKTTQKNYAKTEHFIKKLHSYETPCIISLAIENGYKPFLEWIENSVG